MRSFPVADDEARAQASAVLDELQPAALFTAERAGFSESGVYHNARGVDFSEGKARIELGLINSPVGRVDPNVDNIPLVKNQAVVTHQAVVTLLAELAHRAL